MIYAPLTTYIEKPIDYKKTSHSFTPLQLIQTHLQDKRVILKSTPFHTNIKERPSQWQILKTFTQS